MAEGVTFLEESIRDGHKITYNFRFHGLGGTTRRCKQIQYNTGCPTTPASWMIELICEHVPGGEGYYDISIKFRRMDYSSDTAMVAFFWSFFDASGRAVASPVSYGRRIPHEESEKTTMRFSLSDIRILTTVKFTIEIVNCHSDTNLQCVSKFITNQKSIDQNEKL